MDLLTLLASAIHDAKNQLHQILADATTLAQMNDPVVQVIAARLEHRSQALDRRLVALLGIYRLGREGLVSIAEHHVSDLLNSVAVDWAGAVVVCDEDLVGYFDAALLRTVVSDALDNAQRFGRGRLLLTAHRVDKSLVISIEDDGPGFRSDGLVGEELTDDQLSDGELAESKASSDEVMAQTGLGLYLAAEVAKAHQNNGVTGHIERASSSQLGGAALRIHLP
ncbi:MAG: K+-sensing histidine kinase KdpD [Candidatus Azotimanducaceae bacterium]|jgi:K+-sensing histidine kinase KdpD